MLKCNYVNCNVLLKGRQKRFCSIKCKNRFHQNGRVQYLRGLNRKKYFIEQLGGKCSKCNYNKNLAALCFHHLSDKEISLDMRSFSNHNLEKLSDEVKKCILLCSNCHMESHYPHHTS